MLDFWFIDIGILIPRVRYRLIILSSSKGESLYDRCYFTSASMAEVAGKLASTYSLSASIRFHEHDNSAPLEHADLAWCLAKTCHHCHAFRTTISLGKRIVSLSPWCCMF